MNSEQYIKFGTINVSRLRMAVERHEVLVDKDHVLNLTQARPLRKWSPAFPDGTRYWAVKNRNEVV